MHLSECCRVSSVVDVARLDEFDPSGPAQPVYGARPAVQADMQKDLKDGDNGDSLDYVVTSPRDEWVNWLRTGTSTLRKL
jgi:hypothetical protein